VSERKVHQKEKKSSLFFFLFFVDKTAKIIELVRIQATEQREEKFVKKFELEPTAPPSFLRWFQQRRKTAVTRRQCTVLRIDRKYATYIFAFIKLFKTKRFQEETRHLVAHDRIYL
jgi:hypothetical protein